MVTLLARKQHIALTWLGFNAETTRIHFASRLSHSLIIHEQNAKVIITISLSNLMPRSVNVHQLSQLLCRISHQIQVCLRSNIVNSRFFYQRTQHIKADVYMQKTRRENVLVKSWGRRACFVCSVPTSHLPQAHLGQFI